MSETGNPLRRTREAKNLTIAEVEKALHIKARFIAAMEDSRWDELPGPVQARGFLKNYAAFLGLNGDATSLLNVARVAPPAPAGPTPLPVVIAPPPAPLVNPPAPPATPHPAAAAPPPASPEPMPMPGWFSIDLIAGGVALVLFVIVAILIMRSYVWPLISNLAAPPPTPTLLPGAAVHITPSPTITPTAAFPLNPTGGIQISLAAVEHAWVRITTDGMTAFEGLLTPAQTMTWEAKEQLIVETGNGAAFNYVLNGRTMGTLGERNTITIRAWNPQGPISPPPTLTPAPPTDTPEPVPTLAPASPAP